MSITHDFSLDTAHSNPIEKRILNNLVGVSTQIKSIRSLIKKVAPFNTTVLITGASGTGKEVIAECIHALSRRSSKCFLPINCGAIPNELMESELFGHEKGAFTGAIAKRVGRFEAADSGTLFLDEIGDMAAQMQVKLLRVLQNQKITRVGGSSEIVVDVRLIAATNKDLQQCILNHTFREDLYYRLNVFPIHMPSLQERPVDIPILINHYLKKLSIQIGSSIEFDSEALAILQEYSWPGNIRELANIIERMIITHQDKIVTAAMLPEQLQPKGLITSNLQKLKTSNTNFRAYLAHIERTLIESALKATNGMIAQAAKELGLRRTTLIEKIKKYNISYQL